MAPVRPILLLAALLGSVAAGLRGQEPSAAPPKAVVPETIPGLRVVRITRVPFRFYPIQIRRGHILINPPEARDLRVLGERPVTCKVGERIPATDYLLVSTTPATETMNGITKDTSWFILQYLPSGRKYTVRRDRETVSPDTRIAFRDESTLFEVRFDEEFGYPAGSPVKYKVVRTEVADLIPTDSAVILQRLSDGREFQIGVSPSR